MLFSIHTRVKPVRARSAGIQTSTRSRIACTTSSSKPRLGAPAYIHLPGDTPPAVFAEMRSQGIHRVGGWEPMAGHGLANHALLFHRMFFGVSG